jgi:SAM-dependent methyltransferase
VTSTPGEYRLYSELAAWWPLISPPAEYQQDAAALAEVFRSASLPVREVLDLGSGGGHVAAHLKGQFTLTLVDISADMLAVSRQLNPECEHQQGDMRAVRLGRSFDAVLVHDAVDYVTSEADLLRVAQTAFAHCRPGGIAVFAPDHIADTFTPGAGAGGGGDGSGRQASFRERTWDPDPRDEWIKAEYEFVLRGTGHSVEVVRETHRLGAFRRQTWLRVLSAAGFERPACGDATPTAAGHGNRTGRIGLRNLFTGYRPH